MKKLILLLIILSPVIIRAQGIILSPIQVVAPASYDNNRPRIAIAANGFPVVMWTKNAAYNFIYVARKTAAGFSTPVQANPGNTDPRYSSMDGPNLAARNDSLFIVYSSPSSAAGNVYTVRSVDGGLTFGNAVQVNPASASVSELPWVEAGPGGNPVVTYLQIDGNGNNPRQIVVASSNGGSSYGAEQDVTLLAPGVVCECCPPSTYIKDTTHITLFRNNDSNIRDIWASVSYNGGASYTVSTDIDESNWMVNTCPTSGPEAVITGDSAVAVWMSEATGFARIYVGTMSIAGAQAGFSTMVNNVQGNFAQNLPAIAGSGDTLGVVWQDGRNGFYDCAFAWSVSGASGLATNMRLIDTAAYNQYNADIAYRNGTFHIVYQDDNDNTVKYRTVTLGNQTGVRIHSQELMLSLSPNPFSGRTLVHFGRQQVFAFAQLTDVAGRPLRSYTVKDADRLVIEKGELASGMYFLTVRSYDGSAGQARLVIE